MTHRILVVDDDENTRRSLQILLTRAGYDVALARNGQEAVSLWRDLGGDLVLLDLFMPEKDGIETILELRAHTPDVRIIAMSGGGEQMRTGMLGDAKLLGAMLTVKKPFSQGEILAMVERALKA